MSDPASADGARTVRLDLADEASTARLAADLAVVARPGDVLALDGDLGAGKSSFARAVRRARADDPTLEVPSPTYTLAQPYDTVPPAAHFDLYRLGDPSELEELGFREAADAGIVLCEWPERAPEVTERADLVVSLAEPEGDPAGTRRVARVEARGEAARRLARTLEIRRFLEAAGHGEAERRAFPGDASARRYESLRAAGGEALILMDSPPLVLGPPVWKGLPYALVAHTALDIVPFVAIARHLERSGLAVPRVLAFDPAPGLALLTDLGREGVLDAAGRPVAERYEAAARALAELHATPVPDAPLPAGHGRSHAVPPFDREAMAIEVSLLPDWYVPDALGRSLAQNERARFDAAWDRIFERLASAERHIVQRDVHSPNLLWRAGETGTRRVAFLDFQDAMIGPAAYDVASLAQDARVDMPEDLERSVVDSYLAGRRRADPGFDDAGFETAYALMAAQRLTKILGIFVRLDLRDGKPQYRRHIPRLQSRLARTLRHRELAELAALYEEWRIVDPGP